MKLLLILLLSFYFVGCGQSSSESEVNNVDSADSTESEPVFFITHKTTDDESVIIFLKETSFDHKTLENLDSDSLSSKYPYEVSPKECLQIKASQFDNLIVMTGVGGFLNDDIKILCGDSDDNKCKPGSYKIINHGDWVNNYGMVEDNGTHYNCVEINQWMGIKNPRLI